MSSRSLNGQNLNLNNLTVAGNVTLNDATVDNLTVTNKLTTLDLSANGVTTLQHTNVDGNCTMSNEVNMIQNCQINGDLTVLGTLTAGTNTNMEIVYFQLTSNAGTVSQTMTLSQNLETTTNYSVFPSFYYGFGGSGGTYDIASTSSALNQVIITNRLASSFDFVVTKSTGDNINVYIVFLVIYGVYTSGYPSAYT